MGDPFDQDDWDSYAHLLKSMGEKVQIVGDDLLVTNTKRISKALEVGACNALLLKVNQIGSITEAIEAATMSQAAGWALWCRTAQAKQKILSSLTWWSGSALGRLRQA